jgi:hypothetical protein
MSDPREHLSHLDKRFAQRRAELPRISQQRRWAFNSLKTRIPPEYRAELRSSLSY